MKRFLKLLAIVIGILLIGGIIVRIITTQAQAQTSNQTLTIQPEAISNGEFIIRFQESTTPENINEEVAFRSQRAQTTLGRLQNNQDAIVRSLRGQEAPEIIQAKLQAIESEYDAEKVAKIDSSPNTYIYSLKDVQSPEDVRAVLTAYEELPIESIQPNFKYYLTATPNDTNFGRQWGARLINAPAAWDISTGSVDVKVAVVDSGIDASHPDLSQNVKSSKSIAPGCVSNGDSNGHGSHVAGIIGATANNGQGVAGINWTVSIYGYCVVSPSGVGTSLHIAQGIRQAIAEGVDVINLSLGGPILPGQDNEVETAIQEAYDKGITIVSAAGNCGKIPPGEYKNDNVCYWGGNADKYSPGALDTTINVAALGPNSEHPEYSNTGSKIDISAPGGNPVNGSSTCQVSSADCIHSTWPLSKTCPSGGTQTYCPLSGTSMAAPHVSGTVALLKAVSKGLTPSQIRSILAQTSNDLGTPGKDPVFGNGRLDAAYALEIAIGTVTIPPSTPTPDKDCEKQKRAGDYNCDGHVSLADFESWRQDFIRSEASLTEFEWFRAGFTQ